MPPWLKAPSPLRSPSISVSTMRGSAGSNFT